jgi:plasmid maintenance system killer protein
MIKSFKHKGLENLYLNGIKKGVQAKHVKRLLDILDLLNAADNIQVMNCPPVQNCISSILKVRIYGLYPFQAIGEFPLNLLIAMHI